MDYDNDGKYAIFFTNGAEFPVMKKTHPSFYRCLMTSRGSAARPRTDVVHLSGATMTPAGANPTRMVSLPNGFLSQSLDLLDVSAGATVPHQVIAL